MNIALAIADDGGFTWTVSGPGKPPATIAGTSTLADGVLTLAGKGQDGPLAGKLAWQDADHFTFRLAERPAAGPGAEVRPLNDEPVDEGASRGDPRGPRPFGRPRHSTSRRLPSQTGQAPNR